MKREILEARKDFAKRLRELRKKKKWTQMELANRAKIHVRHIQRLESLIKTSAIELDSIIKLAKAFKITPSDLLSSL
ncbi:MAG: helix-turn-helix transcriptional regulator [Candidatus Omnitrophica bacterium]|nr:helix-turn-helix transcriptional regulator [Candidatus Omnitrophota bacterium]